MVNGNAMVNGSVNEVDNLPSLEELFGQLDALVAASPCLQEEDTLPSLEELFSEFDVIVANSDYL
jgi:hypothetical protein